jgi:hypothetical protein
LVALIRLPVIFRAWQNVSPEKWRIAAIAKWVETEQPEMFRMADAAKDEQGVDPYKSTITRFVAEARLRYATRWDPYGQFRKLDYGLTTSSPSGE